MGVMIDHPKDYFSQWIAQRSDLLQELEVQAAKHEIPIVGPVVGRLLNLLVRLKNARTIIELGTATGYSAIFMGEACVETRGRVITFELDSDLAEQARTNIRRAGLQEVIEVRCANAFDALATLDTPADMIFMDIEKSDYAAILPMCALRMAPHGLLVADNTGFKDADGFNRVIHESPIWSSVNLWAFLPGHSPENDGICIALKR